MFADTNTKTRIKASGFFETFRVIPVNDDWITELYNYIICGLRPGGFHRACFENNLVEAAHHSHIQNDWNSIQEMMRWLDAFAPESSWGNYAAVNAWLKLEPEIREEICHKCGFLLTDKEVTWKRLEEEHIGTL